METDEDIGFRFFSVVLLGYGFCDYSDRNDIFVIVGRIVEVFFTKYCVYVGSVFFRGFCSFVIGESCYLGC